MIATSVLPDPDLALEQPVHRDGPRHVGGDRVDRPLLVAGELVRERGEEPARRSSPSTVCAIPDASASIARLRATSPTCIRRNSSKRSRRCALRAASIDAGWWTSRYAVGAVDAASARRGRPRAASRPARPPSRARSADDRLDLPRRHVGLARLRVDRHDDPGLRVAGPPEHVDDRVRELALAAVHVELPVERDLGARASAASRATAG